MPERCWCGNARLLPFGAGYARCPECETLVDCSAADLPQNRVSDDQEDYYGRRYWFEHQAGELGLPDVTARARSDLTERALFWLRTMLQYRLPPADLLELGSSHGGFVALLKWAGYSAAGLELSPWVVDFARRTFNVPVYTGPIEEQNLPSASLDGVVLMDVLEHLTHPVETMARAVELLRSDGFILVQTPCYPEGAGFEALTCAGHAFLKMLLPREHIYLFSRTGITRLFERLGMVHIQFEPAFFDQHDLFCIASRQKLSPRTTLEVETCLQSPQQRLVLALLDADDRRAALSAMLSEVERDRAVRLEIIQKLTAQLAESESDRAARLEVIERMDAERQVVAAERQALEQELHWLPLRVLRRLKKILNRQGAELDSKN